MQEDNGRRVLFTKGNTSIDPLSVANQATRTAGAEINQIEKQKNQNIEDVNKILNSTFQTYSTSQNVRNQLNNRQLLSAKTDLQKKQIDYQNLVAQGGLIDNENISFQEKLAKKRQAYNDLQLQIAQNKQLLEGQKGIFQSILGTEESYNQALSEFDNQTQNILNSAERELSFEAKQAEIAVSLENLGAIINSVSTANNNNQIDNIRNSAVNTLNEFEKSGYITPAEKEKTLNNLSKQINNRKVDVFINNIQDRLFKGENPATLVKDITSVYDLTRKGKVFNEFYGGSKELAQANQIENETKLRNLFAGMQTQIISQRTEIVLDDIDYSRPAIQNIDLVNQQTKNEPQEVKDKALALFEKNQKLYNEKPADFFYSKNPNANINQVQNWLTKQGLGDKSAVATNSQLVSAMKSDFSNLGNITTSDGTSPKSRDQLELVYQNYLERFIPPKPKDKQETEIEASEREKRGKELLAKEVKIHGEGIDYMLMQARNNEDEDFLNELINVRVEKNSPKGLPVDKAFKVKDFIASEHKGLQYIKNKDPALYEKVKNGVLEVANYRGQAVNDVADKMYKNNDFIINDKTNVKVDKTKYDKSDINSRIAIAKRNALQIFANQKNIIGKYDLAENLFVSSNDEGNLDFILQDQKGNRDFLGTLSPDNLPTPNYINPFENLSKNITIQQAQSNQDINEVLKKQIKNILSTPFPK